MKLATFAATLAMGTLAWAGGPNTTPTRSVTAVKKAPAATVRRATASTAKSTLSKAAASRTTATSAKHTVKRSPLVRTTWRTRQTSPTADRYREIQEALVARGYLSAEDATGAWGAASSEAMKKFQTEQSLDSTGKIDSLSLIALGLGPRHDNTVSLPHVVDGNIQAEAGHNN